MMENKKRKIIRDTQTQNRFYKSRKKATPIQSRQDRVIIRDSQENVTQNQAYFSFFESLFIL